MSYRALFVSIGLALVWTGAALYATRQPAAKPLRHFAAYMGENVYRVDATEVRTEGFCSVFVRDDVRVAGICGQHTWSEGTEVQ